MTSAAFSSRKVYLGATALMVGNFPSLLEIASGLFSPTHSVSDDDGHY